MLKRLDLVLDSRKFVQEWPEKRQFLVKLRQIWNDFRHCAGSKSFFSSLLSDRLLLAAALDPCEPKFASFLPIVALGLGCHSDFFRSISKRWLALAE